MPFKSEKKRAKYFKDWERKHRLTTTGHRKLVGEKRPYPTDGICELCSSKNTSLDYHHWDDTTLSKGLWLCRSCHISIEWFEHGDNSQRSWVKGLEEGKFVERYIKLKAKINGI